MWREEATPTRVGKINHFYETERELFSMLTPLFVFKGTVVALKLSFERQSNHEK